MFPDMNTAAGSEPEKKIVCPGCGTNILIAGPCDELTAGCPSCQTVIHLGPGMENPQSAGKSEPAGGSPFSLDLGATGRLKGSDWQIVGRLQYLWKDEGEIGSSQEYVLYNDNEGYVYLGEEYGHFMFSLPTELRPSKSLFDCTRIRQAVKIGKKRYRFTETSRLTLHSVEGYVPYRTAIGDTCSYAEAVSPPFLFSEERCGETEAATDYFLEEYIPAAKIAQRFKGRKSARGVAPAQPYEGLFPGETPVKYASVLIAIALFFGSCLTGLSGTDIQRDTLNFNRLTYQKKEILLKPFKIEKPGETLQITFRNSQANSWMEFGLALVNVDEDTVLAADDAYMEYYEGVEGGESWSEGSQEHDIFWKIKKPGNYRLLLTVWDTDVTSSKLVIRVQKDVYRAYFLAILFFLWVGIPVILILRRRSFEKRRWAL